MRIRAISLRLLVTAACLLPVAALAHPGTGIVVDARGQVYFVDMVSGVWKLDPRGALTHVPGPAFHWMTQDASDRFSAVRLPSGADGDIARLGAKPTLILASDVPVAMGDNGALYYPSHSAGTPLQILKLLPTGQTSVVARVAGTTATGPLRDLKGLATGSDESLFYTEDDAIRRVSKRGEVSTVLENATCQSLRVAGATGTPLLRGLALSGEMIFVAATGCAAVLKVTLAGAVTVLPQIDRPWAPTGIAVFGSDVYVLEFADADSDDRQAMLPRVRRIGADGKTAVIATVRRH